jgi:hypothetical protein
MIRAASAVAAAVQKILSGASCLQGPSIRATAAPREGKHRCSSVLPADRKRGERQVMGKQAGCCAGGMAPPMVVTAARAGTASEQSTVPSGGEPRPEAPSARPKGYARESQYPFILPSAREHIGILALLHWESQ